MIKEIFSERITKQREAKGISQKQAAIDLGVSQALLSHYENGVRECGLDFVVKVADYYNVSCDYLLGHSNKTVFIEGIPDIVDVKEDETISRSTVGRAALTLTSHVGNDKELMNFILRLYGITTYIAIAGAARRGVVSKEWIGNEADISNISRFHFLAVSLAEILDELEPLSKNINDNDNDKEKPPKCVSTISSWAYDYLNIKISEIL